MSVVREFLVGVFTRHLATKFLSLVLSVMVFGFFQSTLTGQRVIDELRLSFTLSPDLQGEWVLLQESVSLRDVKIRGLRSVVEALARELKKERRVDITQRFLTDHGSADERVVRITARVLQDSAILGKDVEVIDLPEAKQFGYDRIAERPAVVLPDPGTEVTLPEDFEYQGTLESGSLNLAVEPNRVTLRGPERLLVQTPQIFVVPPPLRPYLAERGGLLAPGEERTEVVMPPGELAINWSNAVVGEEGLRQLRHFRVVDGGTPFMPAAFGERQVRMRFEIQAKLVRGDLQDVPLISRDRVGSGRDITQRTTVGSIVRVGDLEAGRVSRVPVLMPQSLWAREELLRNLVLVIDLANARESEDTDAFFAPFYLDVLDRSRTQDLRDLERIELDFEEKEIEFGKKAR